MSDDNCLDAASADGPVKLVRCHGKMSILLYNFVKFDLEKRFLHLAGKRCNRFRMKYYWNGGILREQNLS